MQARDLHVGSWIRFPGATQMPMLAMKGKPNNGVITLTCSYDGEHRTETVPVDQEIAVPFPWPQIPPGTRWMR